jgi:hypothetical protein
MPACTASDCNDETPLEGTLCADHLEQAAAYYLVERRKRLIWSGEVEYQEDDPDQTAIIIQLHNNLNR